MRGIEKLTFLVLQIFIWLHLYNSFSMSIRRRAVRRLHQAPRENPGPIQLRY